MGYVLKHANFCRLFVYDDVNSRCRYSGNGKFGIDLEYIQILIIRDIIYIIL